VPGPNPTVRQREVGTRLRQLRNALGLTVDEVAQRLLCSATKISRIETGARRASLRDVRDLCQIYDLNGQDTAELMELAREARQPGWWAPYTDLNLTPYIGLEHEAVAITAFSMYAVPALLQTKEYAEALARLVATRTDPAILSKRIEALARRQEIFERDHPPRYRALLDEAVLHRRIGNRTIMAAQLDKILVLAQGGQVTVQVIPFSAGAHGSADSNFEFFEFGKDTVPPVVYVAGLVSNLYQEKPTDIERYREAADYLRDIALAPKDSQDLIKNVMRLASSGKSHQAFTTIKD
jgi:transcriptional regulator with XRE-family HTH domain